MEPVSSSSVVTFVDAQGIAVATAWAGGDAGDPPLVWLHGLAGSATGAFAGVASHRDLSGWSSLLIDLPGHGASEAPENWSYEIEEMADLVMEVVSSLVECPVMLFGHSMGGSVAIACAHRYPGSIDRLIVAEPNLDPGKGALSVRIAAQEEDRFVRQGYPAFVRATRASARQGDVESRDWLPTLELADPRALHRSSTSLLAERAPTFREQLAGLSIPVATIRGELSPSEQVTTDGSLRGYVVPGTGHEMIAGNPEGFVSALVAAIRQEPDPAATGDVRR
jgi:pimeloyl-ACP methyl ester carboxylesterase